MKNTVLAILACLTGNTLGAMSLSTGFEISPLNWSEGTHTPWSFSVAFGPRIYRDIYLRGKVSYPLPFFIIVGNQFSAGGEVEWLALRNRAGFCLKASLGAAWCSTWPEDFIVILADGDTSEPPDPEPFESASGMRYVAEGGLGVSYDCFAFWLDLGIDHRDLSVERFVGNNKVQENHTFTGPVIGLSTEIFF